MMIHKNKDTLKYVSLITLTVQNAALGLSMRHSRSREGDRFISTTAVFMAELTKLLICLGLVFLEVGKDSGRFVQNLYTTIIQNYVDTIKICVPSMVYVIQNNLLYVSASHLDAATYQVTYQLKILTTAMFAVVILRKKLLSTQWAALLVLVIGVATVQLSNKVEQKSKGAHEQNRLLGFSAALGACFLSGFAGIYFEKMLKGADISVWMRNVQLSLLSLPLGLIMCLVTDYTEVSNKGFFFGYDAFIVYLVILQAAGGLLVAVVVKYADNILKGFATSLAIIITCVASIFLFGFVLSVQFVIGAGLVIASIFLYGFTPKQKSAIKTSLPNLNNIDDEEQRDVRREDVEKNIFLNKV